MTNYQRIFHILLRRCLVTKCVHLVGRTFRRTIDSIRYNLNVRTLHSCLGYFVVSDFMSGSTATQSIRCMLLLVIEALIKPILGWSAVISLCFGCHPTCVKWLVDQIAQNIRLLGHIYWLPFFANCGSWLLSVIDAKRGHRIVHIAGHDGLRSSLQVRRCGFFASRFSRIHSLEHLLGLQCLQDGVWWHHRTRLRPIRHP